MDIEQCVNLCYLKNVGVSWKNKQKKYCRLKKHFVLWNFLKQRKKVAVDLWISNIMNDEMDWKFIIIIFEIPYKFLYKFCHTSCHATNIFSKTLFFPRFSLIFFISFTATINKLTANLSTFFFFGEELELFYYFIFFCLLLPDLILLSFSLKSKAFLYVFILLCLV